MIVFQKELYLECCGRVIKNRIIDSSMEKDQDIGVVVTTYQVEVSSPELDKSGVNYLSKCSAPGKKCNKYC